MPGWAVIAASAKTMNNASHRVVVKLKTSGILPRRVQVRSCKYLNSVIEQDHRRIKQRIRPMLGFKRFETAAVTIRGIPVSREKSKNISSILDH